MPILIPPTAPHSYSSGAGTVGPVVAGVPSGFSPSPLGLHKTEIESTDFIEAFASQKSRNVSLCF
jgi:hypothetical protein